MLELALNVADFVDAPRGRYVCGQSFLYACFDETLFATCLWGNPDADIAMLAQAYEAEIRVTEPHVSLFDGSRLDTVDRAPFVPLTEFIHHQRSALVARVRRVALVRPRGLVGIVMAGFRDLLDPIPSELFADPTKALEWLGRSDAADVSGELESLVAQVEGGSAIVRQVRALLANDIASWTCATAARRLGVTERTLQRRLKEASTTFRAEYRAAQVREAERLLRNTDANLTAIAIDVGCSSLPQFSTLFREINGVSPSVWRARSK